MDHTKFDKTPNIGSILSKRLIEAKINSPEELKKIGSKKAFLMIKSIDKDACLSMLNALEGAVQGIRWHSLDQSTKEDLKDFFKSSN